jgi:hypothetical protein
VASPFHAFAMVAECTMIIIWIPIIFGIAMIIEMGSILFLVLHKTTFLDYGKLMVKLH